MVLGSHSKVSRLRLWALPLGFRVDFEAIRSVFAVSVGSSGLETGAAEGSE